jgi:hypothetical protein
VLLVAGGGAAATTAPLLTWRFPLYPGPSQSSTTSQIEALPNQKLLALVVALVLSLGAFVLSAREAQAEQKSTAAHQPTMATGSGSPLVPQAEQPPPVQTPAFETALPKTPPPALTESVVAPQLGPLPSAAHTPSSVTPPAGTPPPEAPPAVSVHGDAISSVDQPVRDRSPVTDKPSAPPTTGGTAGEDASYAPIPNNKKKEAEEPLARHVDRQQAASTPPASLPADPKKEHTSRLSSERVTGGPLSKLSTLSKEEEEEEEEKNKDPLSPPLKQEKKSSALLPTTFDGSGAQAQLLPKAHATLEPPTTAILLPLGVSPAANDTITAAVPIDHPAASTATSASILWKGAPVAVGSARDLPTPHPKPSGSIVVTIDNAVHQELVSDLASSHELSSSGRQITSEGTPAAPPPASPVPYSPWEEQDSFALSSGGGMSSTGGIGLLLLLGILAFGGWLLLRPDFRTYLASCELPKLSSALLMPLERPG